ncbi:MAG: U32 family peptidase [Tissierellia bacterium]|nr:U32 family peptidase [Tissierellia bacterium]
MNLPEVLAPAGSMEALKAGVAAGCHAVYLGGKLFSARAFANNFSKKELEEAVSYCHMRNVKVYVTMNTLLSDKELSSALEYARYLYEIGVDAIIVQDMGLVRVLQHSLKDMPLHGSTQLFVHNLEGAKVLVDLGFERIVLARETPLSEIKRIKNHVDVEIEYFVHGALCVCYSGQCLMSSMIGGRSGNRGACAQPCRKSYQVVDRDQNIYLDGHILSPMDLNTSENLDKLLEAGVDSLKIEGRMKSPEYVGAAVSLYNKAIKERPSQKDIDLVAQNFNRGFTKGLPLGDFGKKFVSMERPDNRGLVIGKVLSLKGNTVKITLTEPVYSGDGLEFSKKRGGFGGLEVHEYLDPGIHVLKLPFSVKKGTDIRRTFSVENKRELDEIINQERKRPLYGTVSIKKGKVAFLTITLDHREYKVTGNKIVEEAKNVPLTLESVENQLNKLGDTPFFWKELDIFLEDNLFLPKSELNDLRRLGLEKILEKPVKSFGKNEQPKIEKRNEAQGLSIFIEDISFAKRLDSKKCNRLLIPFHKVEEGLDLLDSDFSIYIELPSIGYGKEMEEMKNKLDTYYQLERIKGIYIPGLSGFSWVNDFPNWEIYASEESNIFNGQSVAKFYDLGADSFVFSPECTLDQIKDITGKIGNIGEIISYGQLVIMKTEHCPMSLYKDCINNQGCKSCEYSGLFYLKDSLNYLFPFRRVNNRSLIYHSRPIFLGQKVRSLVQKGLSLQIRFTNEGEPMELLQEYYYNLLYGGQLKEREIEDVLKDIFGGYTIGNYKRGILGGVM